MSYILFAGLCRRLKFSSKIDGYALQFHVIKTFELSIYVGPSVSSACTHRCIMDPVCVSVNIGPPTDETFICELSDSDHTKQPADLRKREGFLYIGTEVLIVFLNKKYELYSCEWFKKVFCNPKSIQLYCMTINYNTDDILLFYYKIWNKADLLWNFGFLGIHAANNNISCQACPTGTFANNSEYCVLKYSDI